MFYLFLPYMKNSVSQLPTLFLQFISQTTFAYNKVLGFSTHSFSIRQEFTLGNTCWVSVSRAICLFYGEFNNEYLTIGHLHKINKTVIKLIPTFPILHFILALASKDDCRVDVSFSPRKVLEKSGYSMESVLNQNKPRYKIGDQ